MGSLGKPMSFHEALDKSIQIKSWLITCSTIKEVKICGSLRRNKPTINDIDVVIVTDTGTIPLELFNMKTAKDIAKGPIKWTFIDTDGIQVDIMSCKKEQLGAFMCHCTGSKWENIRLRKIAIVKGWQLSQYGLIKRNGEVVAETEEAIYGALGLKYVEPYRR